MEGGNKYIIVSKGNYPMSKVVVDCELPGVCFPVMRGEALPSVLRKLCTKLTQIQASNNYILPQATETILGGVKVDGITIKAVNGVISAVTNGGTSAVEWEAILNKPNFFSGNYADLTNKPVTPILSTVATTGDYNDLLNKPTITGGVEQINSNWAETDPTSKGFILNKPTIPTVPTLATVATTGSYNDLLNKPSIPTIPTLATVATTGNYNDLLNKPVIIGANNGLTKTTDEVIQLGGTLGKNTFIEAGRFPFQIHSSNGGVVTSSLEIYNGGWQLTAEQNDLLSSANIVGTNFGQLSLKFNALRFYGALTPTDGDTRYPLLITADGEVTKSTTPYSATPPSSGNGGGNASIYNEILIGNVDGNKIFTTTQPFVAGTTRVYENGQRLLPGIDYNESSTSQITFFNAPVGRVWLDYDV